MAHTKMDLQAWISGITNGEIPFIDPPPEFYFNDKWSQEELADCVNAVMQHEQYNHDIAFHVGYKNTKLISLGVADFAFSYLPAVDNGDAYIRLNGMIIRGNPFVVDVPISNKDATDRNKVEIKIEWLTHMGCHLVTKWYKDQLFAAAWKSMEENVNE